MREKNRMQREGWEDEGREDGMEGRMDAQEKIPYENDNSERRQREGVNTEGESREGRRKG